MWWARVTVGCFRHRLHAVGSPCVCVCVDLHNVRIYVHVCTCAQDEMADVQYVLQCDVMWCVFVRMSLLTSDI